VVSISYPLVKSLTGLTKVILYDNLVLLKIPMRKYPSDYVIYKGPVYTVEWYYTQDGKMPAYEYFKDMEEKYQDRFLYMVKYLADSSKGTRLPATMYNLEDRAEKVYAFKPGAERLFNFMYRGGKVIITNAYRKHSQRMDKKDKEKLKVAAKYKRDYLKRVKEGTYYG